MTPELFLRQHFPSCKWHMINPVAQILKLSFLLPLTSHIQSEKSCWLNHQNVDDARAYHLHCLHHSLLPRLLPQPFLCLPYFSCSIIPMKKYSSYLSSFSCFSMALYHTAKKTQTSFLGQQNPTRLTSACLSDNISYHSPLYLLNSSCPSGHQIHSCYRTSELVSP